MNSLLGSAALILLGMTANALLTYPKVAAQVAHPENWDLHPGAVSAKLFLLILVFSVAFSYYMSALRRLGQFNLVRQRHEQLHGGPCRPGICYQVR